jgi:alkanesulfonate monooxygenase SsuD/methylene tetrahydromethanopterin reductase-like flavin-dependent oxidoreductase (luciferase family)
MSAPRIVLILTENWTMRPAPNVPDLVQFGSPVSHDGKHYSFGQIWVEPPSARPGGPVLWFGGSSLHPRLIARLVRYGSGFNPHRETAGIGAFCRSLAAKAAALSEQMTKSHP